MVSAYVMNWQLGPLEIQIWYIGAHQPQARWCLHIIIGHLLGRQGGDLLGTLWVPSRYP